MDRNLDGIFFRVKRGEKYEAVCLSDMTDEEREEKLSQYDHKAMLICVNHLCKSLKAIGDEFKIVGG